MTSLCNYTHPELQVKDGLVRHETGTLFPYNPEFYDTATGLYGPGAIYCWYMLLASVLMNWFFCYANNIEPDLSSDLLGALAYPAFAATDLFIQSVRMIGTEHRAVAIHCLAFPKSTGLGSYSFSDTPLDMADIPPDVLDLGQRVIDILGPCRISWAAGLFSFSILVAFPKPGVPTKRKFLSIRSPHLVLCVALGYIDLSLIVFYFSIGDLGMAYYLAMFEFLRQVMLMGTWTYGTLLAMAMHLCAIKLVWAWKAGRVSEMREALHSIKFHCFSSVTVLVVASITIFQLDMTIVPDLGIQVKERDQLATLIVGVVTLAFTMVDICYHCFMPRDVGEEVTEMLPSDDTGNSLDSQPEDIPDISRHSML